MSILVVCPGCRKSFQVSDKFAGKSGPCPNCKHILHVPKLSEQVQIHEPEEFASGGRNTEGKLDLKPIERMETKLQPVTVVLIAAGTLLTLFVAWAGGRAGLFDHLWATILGLLVVSPPLVVGAYSVLRNDELEPYRGKPLYLRAAICSAAYMVLWGFFSLLAARGILSGEPWVWLFVAPPIFAMGALAALATLDLPFGDGVFHYAFYVLVTMLLRWAAGMKWIWDLTS